MKDMHCPNKPDHKKPLYKFNADILCDELISALKDNYDRYNTTSKHIDCCLYLVPADVYFMHRKNLRWTCSKTIEVSKEQVDKFLALHSICDISFLKFMENEYA